MSGLLRRAFPLALTLTALFTLIMGAACVLVPEDGTVGGGTPSNTSTPESTESASPVTEGKVESVDAEAGQVTLALAGGETMMVNVGQSTTITINGSSGTLEDLQPGDSVKVEVDQETEMATSVTVQGEEATAAGQVTGVDLLSQELTLETQDNRVLHLRMLVLEGSTQVFIDDSEGSLLDLVKGAAVEIEYNPETMVVTTIYIRTDASPGLEVVGDSFTVEHGGSFEGNLLTNDHNPNGGGLVVSTEPAVAPSHGSLTLKEDGAFNYTHDYTHDGSETARDSFTYEACDDADASNCVGAEVVITIESGDDTSSVGPREP